MALPSSRRPKEVEEEIINSFEVKKSNAPKLRLTWEGVFLKTMTEWYKGLNQKAKNRLTSSILKKKAINVCFNHDIVYDTLPKDWVAQLTKECGLKLFERKKKVPVFKLAPFQLSTYRQKKFKPLTSLFNGPSGKFDLGNFNDLSEMIGDDDTVQPNTVPKKTTTKKFLDLSKAIPPPMWLAAYAKGTMLPRVLSVYSTDDLNILYYDYNPKLTDSLGRELKLLPTPRHNVNVFAPR